MFNLLFYTLFLFFSFGMLGRISFFDQQINGYLYEFVMLIIFIPLIIKYRLKPIISAYKTNKYIFWFFLFILSTFIYKLNKYSIHENFVSFLYQIRFIFYFIFFFYLKQLISKKIITFFIIVVGLSSFGQYLLYPDLRNLIYMGWDPHLYRMFGTYLDTYVSVSIYGLIFFYLLFQKKTWINKVLLFCYLLFIILTFSRLGYLAFLVTLFLVYIKNLKYFLLLIIVGFLILIFIPKPWGEGVNLARTFSVNSRVLDYKKAGEVWLRSPLVGFGYNRIRYIKKDLISHSGASYHSSFMIILTTCGIVGFSLFLLSLLKMTEYSHYAPFYLIFISIVSLGDNAFLHPFILFITLTFLSLNLSRK